jgi:hypothetical protein
MDIILIVEIAIMNLMLIESLFPIFVPSVKQK